MKRLNNMWKLIEGFAIIPLFWFSFLLVNWCYWTCSNSTVSSLVTFNLDLRPPPLSPDVWSADFHWSSCVQSVALRLSRILIKHNQHTRQGIGAQNPDTQPWSAQDIYPSGNARHGSYGIPAVNADGVGARHRGKNWDCVMEKLDSPLGLKDGLWARKTANREYTARMQTDILRAAWFGGVFKLRCSFLCGLLSKLRWFYLAIRVLEVILLSVGWRHLVQPGSPGLHYLMGIWDELYSNWLRRKQRRIFVPHMQKKGSNCKCSSKKTL